MFIKYYLDKIKSKSINNTKIIDIEYYTCNTLDYILNTMHYYNLYEYNEIVLGLYYINKLSNICIINNNNINIIFVCCVMLSNKYIIDTPITNSTYSRLLNINPNILNKYEIEILKLFDYSIFISTDEFNTFYDSIKDVLIM